MRYWGEHMVKIMIVEDDPVIAGSMEKYISGWGYEVKRTEDFQDIMPLFSVFQPDLVLMDISLPFFNGYHWCSEIRKVSATPVIFISSASDNMNIIMAMNMGGDDFIAKPFDLSVLIAKLQAVLRRTLPSENQAPQLSHRGAVLSAGDTVLTYQGQRIELSKNSYRILQTLLQRKGSVVSRETLMQRLWETDSYVDENTLTVNINRLRKTLAAAGLTDFITTRKGIGYIIL